MLNVNALAISCPSHRKWDRGRDRDNYTQFQRLRFIRCGRLETQTLRIVSQKNGAAYIITATATIKTTAQAVVDHMAEILEFGRKMPLMVESQKTSAVMSYAGNLPDHYDPKREPSMAEKYAKRLKEDRWDVRRLGEPQDWRLVRQ